MYKALGNHVAHMGVGQEVKNLLALPAAAHKIGVLQDSELMGNRGLGRCPNIASYCL